MEIRKGIAVSPGVAIYPAFLLNADDIRVPRRTVPPTQLAAQHARLDDALSAARSDIEGQRDKVERELGAEPAKIFGFHLGMLQDASLQREIHHMIEEEAVTAEYALWTVIRTKAKLFMQQENALFKERANDLYDIERRVLHYLLEDVNDELENIEHEAILVAHDLTPSQTAAIDTTKIQAIVTEAGGRTSHTAIVARAQGIPAVVGVGSISTQIEAGQVIIVDGNHGLVIIDPDEQQLAEYRLSVERFRRLESTLGELVGLPAVTLDGMKIDLLANIEFPEEVEVALARGAVGVGLYRTEFLFLTTETDPDEEQQFAAFKKAIELLDGRPMTIRTIDLGADKYTQARAEVPERNPFLGCRSIRLCLQDLAMFKRHLRAILRASAHGKLKIMFPLITNAMELRQARMILNDVMEDLYEQGIAYNENVEVGMMIEVPSAALMARSFAQEVDFFSIGTNDLVQYTLAVDRGNERVANLYSPGHPAVLKLIKDVIRAANRAEIEVSLCGEMASDLEYVMLLLGMGLRRLSMTPQSIPEVKKLVRSVTIEQCEKVARRASSYDNERQVLNYLRDETRKVMPEAFDDFARL